MSITVRPPAALTLAELDAVAADMEAPRHWSGEAHGRGGDVPPPWAARKEAGNG